MRVILILVSHLMSVSAAIANDSQLAEFIDEIKTPSFDCPKDQHIAKVDEYLASNQLSEVQRARLFLHKTHWSICQGKMLDAQRQIKQWLADHGEDIDSYAYAMANYQIGFVYDVNEEAERCGYYKKALDASEERKDDIYLSARLSLLTACSTPEQTVSDQLAILYTLLEQFIAGRDKAAIAHIHNAIGLKYGSIGQNSLAAEQYEKAYRIGLDVYDVKNKIPTLISAITAHSVSGNDRRVDELLRELKVANQQVNTPWSNMLHNYLLAKNHLRKGEYTQLAEVIPRLEYYLRQSPHKQVEQKYRWLTANLCVHRQDHQCLRDFIQQEKPVLATEDSWQLKDSNYLKLLITIFLQLGEVEHAGDYFVLYDRLLVKSMQKRQASGRVLGVAQLKAEIEKLESRLAEARSQSLMLALWVALAVILCSVALVWLVLRKYKMRTELDALTGLLKGGALIRSIRQLPAAETNKTNALALFDLHNFREMNRQYGQVNGDLILQQVSKALCKAVRAIDLVGRIESEQFVVCLANVKESIAKDLFERIHNELNESVFCSTGGERMDVLSSMSIYFTPEDFSDISDVLNDMRTSLQKQVDAAPTT